MTTRPIQYQSSATWLSLCCQSDQTMPLRLLYCQWMATRPIQYQSSATWLSLCCQSDKTMPLRLLYCQWMATRPIQYKVMPIRPNNATQITLLLMNDHSTNPIPIQCHLTVKVMPIRLENTLKLLYYQWMTTWPIQYQFSATRLSLCCQSDHPMPIR